MGEDSESDDPQVETPQVAKNTELLKSTHSEIKMEDLATAPVEEVKRTDLEKAITDQTEADLAKLMELKQQYLKATQETDEFVQLENNYVGVDAKALVQQELPDELSGTDGTDEESFALTNSV